MENKTDFRIKAKIIRKSLDMTKISRIICEKIKDLDIYKSANNILIFYPLNDEINLLPLLEDNKNFYLPRINEDKLDICPYKKGDNLKESKFKTQEPLTQNISPDKLDLIILPALAADKDNYRLGYGKGFYDRFLEATNAYTILPMPKSLVFDKIPTEKHDKKVNLIITE